MKKLIILFIVTITQVASAQVTERQPVPDLNFATILNAPVQKANLKQLKGKLVIIEFWATWCGACLEAMPHLQALQRQYGEEIRIITVTNEKAKRTALYLKSRPSNLWFAIDTAEAIAKQFPHQLIPHTVLIDTDGNLIGNVLPETVTPNVIDSLLRRKEVHLTEKKDHISASPEELINSIFFTADTVKERFVMQAEIKGAQGLSTAYPLDPIWKGRRITAINCGLSDLYRMAFGGFPYKRIVDQTSANDKSPAYCLDIIVKDKNELLTTLQNELLKRFDVQAKVLSEMRTVNILKIADQTKFKSIIKNTTGKRTYYSRHGEIDQQAITMSDFAAYLESYGTAKLLVINETGNNDKFDIKFSFQPENPKSLTDILTGMGLVLEQEQRPVNLLKLYK